MSEAAYRPFALIVDDERLIADTLAAILERHGFITSTAYSGEDALVIIRALCPNVLISDVMMSNVSGLDLEFQIRNCAPRCAVILMSGNTATEELLAHAEAQGRSCSVLAKPVHPEDLLTRIAQLRDGPS